MRRYFVAAILLGASLLMLSCADPAANKPKATVTEASPEAVAPNSAATERLAITPGNSKIDFIAAKVTRSHNGSFKQFSGNIDIVNNSIEQSRVSIDIDSNSVQTDDPGLTSHLQTPDFFDVTKFPKATFTSTRIEANPAGGATHNITGNFELHGVKKSVSFPATIQLAADKVSVNAEFSINRKDWGLAYPGKSDDLIRDGVVIKLSLNVPRKLQS
jgi:polyisoprenoid-binding protein YceI